MIFCPQRLLASVAMLLTPIAMLAQDISVSGRVVSASGEPLPGATVIVKGTTKGVATDIDGRFVMPAVPTGATLVFSCVGFADAEVPAKQNVSVSLNDDTEMLCEVIVSTQKRQQTSIDVPVAVSAMSGKGRLPPWRKAD